MPRVWIFGAHGRRRPGVCFAFRADPACGPPSALTFAVTPREHLADARVGTYHTAGLTPCGRASPRRYTGTGGHDGHRSEISARLAEWLRSRSADPRVAGSSPRDGFAPAKYARQHGPLVRTANASPRAARAHAARPDCPGPETSRPSSARNESVRLEKHPRADSLRKESTRPCTTGVQWTCTHGLRVLDPHGGRAARIDGTTEPSAHLRSTLIWSQNARKPHARKNEHTRRLPRHEAPTPGLHPGAQHAGEGHPTADRMTGLPATEVPTPGKRTDAPEHTGGLTKHGLRPRDDPPRRVRTRRTPHARPRTHGLEPSGGPANPHGRTAGSARAYPDSTRTEFACPRALASTRPDPPAVHSTITTVST